MSRLRLVPIVEGHGEVAAVRILLERTWIELLGQEEYLEVLQPIRRPRTKLDNREELRRAVHLGKLKLFQNPSPEEPGVRFLVLLLLDLDPHEGPPCDLAPDLAEWMREDHGDVDTACVLANREYETWFVAAAESLGLATHGDVPDDPEVARSGKKWVQDRMQEGRYSETVDQPALTRRMDLELCRRRSPSFDKLCRELESRRATVRTD